MMRALMAKTLFVLSMMLSAQALAFDVGGLSYSVINATDVEVTGRASGNTATDIVIPATASDSGTTYSVTTIGRDAFFNNALTSVIIPDSVTTIGDRAFSRNALTSVIIADSVTTIGIGAFRENALTSVIIPDSVTTIGNYAFANNALASVIIPDSVEYIWQSAFGDNPLTSAAFEGNYDNFDLNMFGFNPALAMITYCNGATGWPQGFNNGSTIVVTEPVNCPAFGLSAPQITSIEPGNAQVFISVSVADDGGSPITGYTATCFGDGIFFGTSPASPITVSGLTNGEAYECLVTATNALGTSPLSAVSAPVIPLAVPPSAPQITGIEAGNAQVFISVSVANDGGSPITGYTAYCFGDGIFFGTSPTSPITVSGLTNGVAYECLVTATNDIGTSPLSAASALITPVAPPPGC